MKELTFTYELVDRYFHKKLMKDMKNYFIINPDGIIENLHRRGDNPFNGYPGVYMGAGPWWSTEHNYIFSGMFYYIFVMQKSILKLSGKEAELLFCKRYGWPLFHSVQPAENFCPIASLKEASLAPLKIERDNYASMLTIVIPYMKDVLTEYFNDASDELKQEISSHIKELERWVEHLSDERVYYYGLPLRKVYLNDNKSYTHLYYIENISLGSFSEQHKVYSHDDLARRNVYSSHPESDLKELDAPIVPHYDDLQYAEELGKTFGDDEFCELTKEEKDKNSLFNMMLNMEWSDFTYDNNGKVGLKDCWGRIVVPAIYEDCIGCWDFQFLFTGRFCAAVKSDGRWGLIQRNNPSNIVVDFKFDEVMPSLSGTYVVRIDNKYGMITRAGRVLLPVEMDDILRPGFHGSLLFVKENKYGIMLENEKTTNDLFDEIDFDSGLYLFVRRGSTWGYICEDGTFTTKRCEAWLLSTEFYSEESLIHEKEPEEYCPEDYSPLENLKKEIFRASYQIDQKESSLNGKAKVGMDIFRPILYYKLPDHIQFAIDMRRPYQLRLRDDRYHDLIQSWDGYSHEKELLKIWLNEKNAKTGVRNWAEAVYIYFSRDDNKRFKIAYTRRKVIDFASIAEEDYESYDFPELVFEDKD